MPTVESILADIRTLSAEDKSELARHARLVPRFSALAVIEDRAGRFLFDSGYDAVKREHFLRPIGGGVDYGELAVDAVRREVMEEIGQKIEVLAPLGTLENIFTFEGKLGHEVMSLFRARFTADEPVESRYIVRDGGGRVSTAEWYSAAQLEEHRVYPVGLLALLV